MATTAKAIQSIRKGTTQKKPISYVRSKPRIIYEQVPGANLFERWRKVDWMRSSSHKAESWTMRKTTWRTYKTAQYWKVQKEILCRKVYTYAKLFPHSIEQEATMIGFSILVSASYPAEELLWIIFGAKGMPTNTGCCTKLKTYIYKTNVVLDTVATIARICIVAFLDVNFRWRTNNTIFAYATETTGPYKVETLQKTTPIICKVFFARHRYCREKRKKLLNVINPKEWLKQKCYMQNIFFF